MADGLSPEAAAPSIALSRPGSGAKAAGVRRILCLKPDHIGDMLIAAPALMLLRKSFPKAHVTLLCAPWNVGLAERLNIADEIHAVSIYSQNSVEDVNGPDPEQRRRQVVAAIEALKLAPFDLAIDLRRDEDTRALLKVVGARALAGFGDLATFSYLDVALPFAHHGAADGATRVHLAGEDLDGRMGHRISPDGLHLTTRLGAVDLSVWTDAIWAPEEDGQPDSRLLGAALWRIDVASPTAEDSAAATTLPRDTMSFGPGWLNWEPWGRWSSIENAKLTLRFPILEEKLTLLVRVQGHTSPSHPRAKVRLSGGGAQADYDFRSGEEPVTLALPCRAEVFEPMARSEPILLRGGRYRGDLCVSLPDQNDWEPLELRIRGAQLLNTIATMILPEAAPEAGILHFPFEIEIRDSAEPILIEVQSPGIRSGGGLAIRSVDLEWLQGGLPTLPTAHMEQQLLDLAAMVALRYAPSVAPAAGDVARNLVASLPGSTAREAVERVRRWRAARGGWLKRKAPRLVIGIGIGANKETKQWPSAYFLDLCQRLLARPDVDLAFIGGPREEAEVAALIGRIDMPGRTIDLCSCCRIEDLGEVLAELDGYVGLDTGTTHFAGRVGLPTVALFGAAHDPREWGPVGERSGWAAADLPCGGCSYSRLDQCMMALRCMTGLTPDDVWPLVERSLFAKDQPRP